MRAINLGPFELGARAVTLKASPGRKHVKKPTRSQSIECGRFVVETQEATPWWRGDLAIIIRTIFPDETESIFSEIGGSLSNWVKCEWVCRQYPDPSSRRFIDLGVDFTVHEVAAKLDPSTRDQVLQEAHDEGLTVAKVRDRVRRIKRTPVAEGQADLEGRYRVIYASPPYHDLTVAEIARRPVAAHAQARAALFLWCPEHLRFGVEPILAGWGFEHRRAIIWDQVLAQRPDTYVDLRHEHLLIGSRGHLPPDRSDRPDSVQTFRRGPGEGYPLEFLDLIEAMYDGPYLWLFAPEHLERDGWTTYGDQVGVTLKATG